MLSGSTVSAMSTETTEARPGACSTCGGPLVQTAERTYHPAATSSPAHPCPDLLPIPGTDVPGFNVPPENFVPDPPCPHGKFFPIHCGLCCGIDG